MSITEADLMRLYLNRISYNYPDIPKIPDTGSYEEAAGIFADIFGLDESGSSAFFSRLDILHDSISRAQILSSAVEQTEDIPAQYPGELRKNTSGDNVRLMQTWLYGVSMFYPMITAPELSGTFGEKTSDSVRSFQKTFSMPVTGQTDRTFWNSLYRTFAALYREELPTAHPFSSELKEGMSGEEIRILQQYINYIHTSLGYAPVLTETGRFGPVTTKEVTDFQKLMKLPSNGIVDESTWNAVCGLYLDAIIGEIKRPFQFPGEVLSV